MEDHGGYKNHFFSGSFQLAQFFPAVFRLML